MREIWSGKQVERFVLNKFLPVRRRFAGFTACFDFPSEEKGFITLSLIFHLCGNFEEIRLLKEDGLNNLSNCECREYNKISLKFITIRSWFRSANLQDWSRQFPVFLYLIEHLNVNSASLRETEENTISGNKKKILLILNDNHRPQISRIDLTKLRHDFRSSPQTLNQSLPLHFESKLSRLWHSGRARLSEESPSKPLLYFVPRDKGGIN